MGRRTARNWEEGLEWKAIWANSATTRLPPDNCWRLGSQWECNAGHASVKKTFSTDSPCWFLASEFAAQTPAKTFGIYKKGKENPAQKACLCWRMRRKRLFAAGIRSRPAGEQAGDVKRGSRFERTNVTDARRNWKHHAVECCKHSTDSGFFERWFTNSLLRETPKGYTVIMDNARFHRKKILRKPARGKALLLSLPPYSPDYNPIEKSWQTWNTVFVIIYRIINLLVTQSMTISMDLFGNPVGSRTSLAFFRAKALQKCGF